MFNIDVTYIELNSQYHDISFLITRCFYRPLLSSFVVFFLFVFLILLMIIIINFVLILPASVVPPAFSLSSVYLQRASHSYNYHVIVLKIL